MPTYIVRVALADETNDGWVWIFGPSTVFIPRTIVAIRRPGRCRPVYVEARKGDRNFCKKYNADPRIDIVEGKDTVIMAEWYRRALAISRPTAKDNTTDTVELTITEPCIPIWPSLRAACSHPDRVVRLGARLGVLGTWLGLLGIWLGACGVWPTAKCSLAGGFVIVVLLGPVGLCATWGPPRPRME